jgi:tRNA A37 threonylcarbamoyltransferase TsaD
MSENNQQFFINEVELKKMLYNKRFKIPGLQIKNWDVSFSAMMDRAIYEITNTVLAEEKIDKIDVTFEFCYPRSFWDEIKDIIKQFKFIPMYIKNKIYVNWKINTQIKTIDLKQYILYPSLPDIKGVHKICYKVYAGKVV